MTLFLPPLRYLLTQRRPRHRLGELGLINCAPFALLSTSPQAAGSGVNELFNWVLRRVGRTRPELAVSVDLACPGRVLRGVSGSGKHSIKVSNGAVHAH
jgi:hypothetical protein